jgi:hypothetical protein
MQGASHIKILKEVLSSSSGNKVWTYASLVDGRDAVKLSYGREAEFL